MKIENAETEKKTTNSISFFQLQYSFLKRKDIVVIIFATIASLALGIAMPLFSITFGGSINTFGAQAVSTPDEFIDRIRKMCLQFVYIGLGMWAAGLIMVWLWTQNGLKITKRIKKDYFKLLMKQEQGFFEINMDILKYPTKIQAQLKKIEMGIGEKVGNILMAFTTAISSYIVGFVYSWKLALVLFSFVPFIVILGIIMVYLMRSSGSIDSRAYESAGAVAEETINNIKTIASFAHFEYEIKRYKENTEKSLKAGLKVALYTGLTMGILFFAVFASYTLAIWFGSRLIYEKEYNSNTHDVFRAGDVLLVLFTVVFGSFSLGQAAPNISAISQACNEAYDFFQLRKRVPQIDLSKSNLKPTKESVIGQITFSKVAFTYPRTPDRELFTDLNLVIEPNKITAIVGASGSGKSTIISLIERLYDVDSGEILIDSFKIKELDLEYFRSLIGYVPQEPVLFNLSIRDNIIFGRENITNNQIWDALQKAYADEFIKTEDDLDYIVGMKGGKLSGGQKQRIAVARAILTQPKFLILDEATSALDYESEKIVQMALNRVSQGITTIVVAHRLSTILNADKIIVLSEGKIVEEGNHTNLLALNGTYSQLVRKQLETVEMQIFTKEEINREKSLTEKANHFSENVSLLQYESAKQISSNNPKRKNSYILLHEKIAEQSKKKEEIKKLAGDKRKRLWSILVKRPWTISGAAFFSVCTGACWPLYGILLADSIYALSHINLEEVKIGGFIISIYFLALAGGALISYFFQGYLFSSIGEHLTFNLRNSSFIKYLSLHMGYYDIPENKPNTLTSRLSSETTLIKGVAITMIGVTVQAITTLLISIILGFIFDWRLTLINIGFLPFILFTSAIRLQMREGFSNVNEVVEATSGGIVSESIINTKTIFCYNMQDKVVNLYNTEIRNGAKTIQKNSFINGILFGFSQLFMFFTYAALFYAGASFMYNGTLNMQDMFRALFVLLFAGFGLGQSQQYVGDIGKSREALVSIFSTLDEKSLIDPFEISSRINPPAIKSQKIFGKIEFRDVSFSYPSKPDKFVLKNVSFIIQPGQKVAFVGHSGSGKSTIVQLVERFYDVTCGVILIDDVDIKNYDLIVLRSFISLVMQEPVLFNRTNSENIKYGKLDATREEIENAAREANIYDLITLEYDRNLPSGGQKQKLAIARAIIRNPSILLLDEATSALDSNSEVEVQRTLDKIMEGRTTITIAHKLSTIRNSNLIYVMEKGELIEAGTHSELMNSKGKYFELVSYGSFALSKLEHPHN